MFSAVFPEAPTVTFQPKKEDRHDKRNDALAFIVTLVDRHMVHLNGADIRVLLFIYRELHPTGSGVISIDRLTEHALVGESSAYRSINVLIKRGILARRKRGTSINPLPPEYFVSMDGTTAVAS